jgi:hypothetical protein
MSDPNEPIEYLRAAVSDLTPVGYTSTCEVRDGRIVVTLCRKNKTRTVTLPEEFQEADSDALTDALKMPMHKAYLELAAACAKKPARKKAKKRKAKRSKKTSAPPASPEATPAGAPAGAEASAAPASTEGEG